MLTKFLNLQNSFTGALLGASLKTYNNINVRQGKPITNPNAHAVGYVKHVEMKLQEMIDKSKSPKGKDKYKNLQKEYKNILYIRTVFSSKFHSQCFLRIAHFYSFFSHLCANFGKTRYA